MEIKIGDIIRTPGAHYEGGDLVECCIFVGVEGVVLLTMTHGLLGNMERYVKNNSKSLLGVTITRQQGVGGVKSI